MWWRSYVECQPAHAPPMNWTSFSSLFMKKYIPQNLRDKRRDEFLSLDQGRMSVTAYEANFVHYPCMPPNFASIHKRGFAAL